MYKNIIKPAGDFIIAFISLLILSPIFVLVALLIKIKTDGSIFFKQKRPGKNNKVFQILKFKTMTNDRDEKGELLPDADRLTTIGKLIRSTSLDELPQLLNVLKGDMSIIGPRPLLVKYIPLYTDFQSRRHDVKPGITGWAQVNGRNMITWEKKFELDVWYVDHISFLLDVKIVFKTIKKVINRKDINSATSATVETFEGTKRDSL
ncbi:sugar transferase [Nonlabens sp. Asnod3-A02]|uniref:sugar transferase n=1 Tax=Nonlabens sp. Asnod3-A02 TaxID=3160579 RepID=UPI0038648E96